MSNSLSNLVNSLAEGVHKIKCKCNYGHDKEKCENCRTKYKYCKCSLVYINFTDDLMECKC